MLIIQLLILAVLLLIVVEDLRYNAVHWALFPVLAGLVILLALKTAGFAEMVHNSVLNICFLTIQLLLLILYYSVKNRSVVNPFSDLLGWGDVLFLVSINFYFSTLNFIGFYILSLICSLISWRVYQGMARQNAKHVPLAGLQAMLLIMLLTVTWWIKKENAASDEWILQGL